MVTALEYLEINTYFCPQLYTVQPDSPTERRTVRATAELQTAHSPFRCVTPGSVGWPAVRLLSRSRKCPGPSAAARERAPPPEGAITRARCRSFPWLLLVVTHSNGITALSLTGRGHGESELLPRYSVRDGRRSSGSGRRRRGDGRRETGDGRRETGDGKRETGDGRRETRTEDGKY